MIQKILTPNNILKSSWHGRWIRRPYLFPAYLIGGFFLTLLGGCSSPESQERVDTLLCWLRPSCLPQDGNTSPRPSQPTKPSPPASVPQQPRSVSTPPPKSVPPRNPVVCRTSAEATFTSAKPFVTVSYKEPTTKANGQPLTNLAKTTIYHDLGKGLIKYKDIPASKPTGGGTIKEKIILAVKEGESLKATICVTATDSQGLEG